jgi:hypothetical protein
VLGNDKYGLEPTMSPRQARRERREAERKTRKAELKRAKAAAGENGFVSYPAGSSALPTRSPEQSDGFMRVDAAAILREPKTQMDEPAIRSEPKTQMDEPAILNAAKTQNDGFVLQKASIPSPSRAEINRANAQHSTGPRSAQGKLASSRNSLKHGLAGGTLLIPGEDAASFEALRDALLQEHQPANQTEALLIYEMAQSYWLTQRAIRLQNECLHPMPSTRSNCPYFCVTKPPTTALSTKP